MGRWSPAMALGATPKRLLSWRRERITRCEAGPPKKDEGKIHLEKEGEMRFETAHCAAGRNGAHGGDDGSGTGGREEYRFLSRPRPSEARPTGKDAT
jgi:hypothetical protein